jgi:hypothetical protein
VIPTYQLHQVFLQGGVKLSLLSHNPVWTVRGMDMVLVVDQLFLYLFYLLLLSYSWSVGVYLFGMGLLPNQF